MRTTEGRAGARRSPTHEGAVGGRTSGEVLADEGAGDGAEDAVAPVEVVAIAVAAVLLGAVLRFVTASPLWLDEALSVNIAQMPVGDLWSWLRHDGHPPLYYVLLHGWMELFGTGDVAVRALSGVFGLLTLPLAWIAGRRRGGPLLAWLALAVVALSPFAVRYSNETRMYALVMLLAFAGYLLVDDVMRRGRGGWLRLVGLALVAAALLWTHYWSIWLLGAVGLLALWRAWRTDDRAERRAAVSVLGALVAAGVLFVPWLPSMLYQSANTGTPWADPMRPTVAAAFTVNDIGSGLYADAGFFALLSALLIALALFGRAADDRRIVLDLRTRPQLRVEALVAAVTFAIGIVAAYALRGAFATRYAAVVFPFLALLLAAGVTRFTGRWVRLGVLVVVMGYLAIGSLWNLRETRTQAGVAAAAVDAYAEPGDLVVFCPDQLGPSGNRAVRDDVEKIAYPTLGDPSLVDWVDYEERNDSYDPAQVAEEILARAGPDRGIFLVWSGLYKTFEEDCETLVATLAAARPTERLVNESGAYFEKEAVNWYPPVS